MDLNNVATRLQEPATPISMLVFGAVLGAVVFWAVVVAPRGGTWGVRIAVVAGFVLPVLVLIVAAVISNPALPSDEPHIGIPLGWRGWAHAGGAVDAAPLLVVLALGSLLPLSRNAAADEPQTA